MDNYRIDRHKLYWHLERVVEWQKGQLIAPIYVEISPTSVCNHRCVFCGVDFARNQGPYLDSAVTCTKIAELGQLGVKSIMFAGEGEPLLHKGLPDFVSTAKQSGIDVSVTTNGSVGSDESWDRILPLLTWLRFSIDAASPEVYAHVHGVRADVFDRVINRVKQVVSLRNKLEIATTIGVQFLILDENLDDVEKAVRLFSEIGVDYLSLKPFSIHPQMVKKMDVNYNNAKVAQVDEIVSRYRGQSPMNLLFRKHAVEASQSAEIKYRHCRALPFWGYISSHGDFHTCSVFLNDPRFSVGNIYEQSMEQILFGERRKQSVEFAQKELCLEGECRLNCRMARINEFLEMLANTPDHVNFI